jgi:KDO2-lipid IV(A) lauroyltransferase
MRKRLEFFIFQLFKWFVLALPLKSAQRLGHYLGGLGYYIARRRRNIALDNVRHAFPDKSGLEIKRIARAAFRNFAISFVELLWFPNLTDGIIRSLVRIRNPELMLTAHKQGRGMVMLAGHFGNWELIALAVAHLTEIPLAVIVQTQNNEMVDAVINKHRCLFGNRVVPKGLAIREIIRTLQGGGVVAIAPDQSGPMEGPFVEFFGRLVSAHQGPAVFALRSGAPMIMGFMLRQSDGTYEVVLENIPIEDIPEYNEQHMVELTRRYTALLERYIRRFPDHWLWLHRRWKHALDGERGEVGGRGSEVGRQTSGARLS